MFFIKAKNCPTLGGAWVPVNWLSFLWRLPVVAAAAVAAAAEEVLKRPTGLIIIVNKLPRKCESSSTHQFTMQDG
jgi:hypothetical protein